MADEFNTSFVDYSFVAFGGALGASFRFFLSTVLQYSLSLNMVMLSFQSLPLFMEKIMIVFCGSLLQLYSLFKQLLKHYCTTLHLSIEAMKKEKHYFLQIVTF